MRLSAAFAFLTALAGTLPLTAARAETPPKVIRFAEVGGGTARPTGYGMVPLAKKLGFFEREFGKNGPAIQIHYFAGTGPAINQALAQDQTDFGSYGGLPNVIGLAAGIPARVVFIRRSLSLNGLVALRPGLPSKSFADLRGKRIAVQKGTNPYMTLVLSLENAGVKEREVTIVNLERADAQGAFLAGHVDGIYSQSQLFALRDQGKASILKSPDIASINATNSSGTLVTNNFERRYPQATARVVKVLTQTAHWASLPENRDAYLRFVADSGIPLKYVRESYDANLKPRFNPAYTPDVIAGYRHIAAFARDHRLIRNSDVSNSWFEPKYTQAALRDLKLQDFWTQAPGR